MPGIFDPVDRPASCKSPPCFHCSCSLRQQLLPITVFPASPTNRFGRPLFRGLRHSDTPEATLVRMRFVDPEGNAAAKRAHHVGAVNTAGLKSE
ncbi:MAG: hypothetical protein HRU46_02225 [Verrucomicrobiales bacterium]|nr:hypothetical protein [Verrucomicrobiales bacterium]